LLEGFKYKLWLGALILFVYPFIAFGLIHGAWFGLPVAETSQWGGFLLTFVLASVGIVAALPLGILLALGRRSKLPVVRTLSVLYIELWRGTPLITVLFMASVLLPLFFASGVDFDKVLRAMIGITMFQSAYTAEAIRGGLQAIPKGQFEAADALGLSYWKKMVFIVLPQALKISIPGIVNTFIELFKDTSLVSIIGLYDLLNMAQTAALGMEWRGYDTEAYIFAAIVFWIFCYGISRYSQHLERKLDTGHRN
jgi:general L-amino acid transport system permease protein